MSPLITSPQVRSWLPSRPQTAHKGSFGRVLVVAGSHTMCGAGYLCAQSALTAGAGLVYWALPQSMQPAFAASLPEVITLPLPENNRGEIDASAWELFPEICEKYNPSLLVAGPGMGHSELLNELLPNAGLPIIVDADALNALAAQDAWSLRWPQQRPSIFTPHAMEMARLLGEEVSAKEPTRQAQVEKLAQLTGGVALLKGSHTLVAACGRTKQIFQNTTGGPELAKGGSGDVLCGLIAGLWAQLGSAQGFCVNTALQATVCGVYVHGLAGNLACQSLSKYSVLARDIITYIAQALKQLEDLA